MSDSKETTPVLKTNDRPQPPSAAAHIIRDIGETFRKWRSGFAKRIVSKKLIEKENEAAQNDKELTQKAKDELTELVPNKAYVSRRAGTTDPKKGTDTQSHHKAYYADIEKKEISNEEKITDEQNQAKEQSELLKQQQEEQSVAEERASMYREHARQIQEQISYWQQQRGQGIYDDSMIDGMLADLAYELSSIPDQFH